jgi:hypothetical protein
VHACLLAWGEQRDMCLYTGQISQPNKLLVGQLVCCARWPPGRWRLDPHPLSACNTLMSRIQQLAAEAMWMPL